MIVILNKIKIQRLLRRNKLIIRPLLDVDQIGELTVDFRLGTDFLVSFQGREAFIDTTKSEKARPIDNFFAATRRKLGQEILLHPNQTVLCSTLEYVKLPKNVYAVLTMRSSFSRLGLTLSTIVQPGYCGCLSLEITNTNNNPIRIAVGTRIVQARLYQLNKGAKYTYGKRKYVGQVRPQCSKINTEKDLEKLKSLGVKS